MRETIDFLFRTFRRTGSACGTVRTVHHERGAFPRRVRSGPRQGELVWGELRHDDVLRILHQPAYAGAFVFGRTRTDRQARRVLRASLLYLPGALGLLLIDGFRPW